MSKLEIKGNKISFVSLKYKDNSDYKKTDLIIDGSVVFGGENPLNISINSNNGYNQKISNNSRHFEFASNDFINVNGKIIKKEVNSNENVVSILNNGEILNGNVDLVDINSKYNNVKDSNKVTLINSIKSNVNKSDKIYIFGNGNTSYFTDKSIIIGNNVTLNNASYDVVIGFNVNSDSDKQILIGDFGEIEDYSGRSVSISNQGNSIYTEKNSELFHIGEHIILDKSIHNDNFTKEEGHENIILDENFDVVVKDSGNYRLNVIGGDSNYIKDGNLYNSVLYGENNGILDVTSNNSIFVGENNKSKNVVTSYIFGNNNYDDVSSNVKVYSYVGGESNNLDYVVGSVVVGESNKVINSWCNFVAGSNNKLDYNDGRHESRKSIIAGYNNRNNSSFIQSIIIGQNFNPGVKLNYSYVISEKNNSVIFGADGIFVNEKKFITYRDFIYNAKNINDWLSKFKYAVITQNKNCKMDVNNPEYYRDRIILKMDKDGYCNVALVYSTLRCVLKFFVENNAVLCNLYSENYKDFSYFTYNINYTKDADGKYVIQISDNEGGNFGRYVTESSKCEILDSFGSAIRTEVKIVGLYCKKVVNGKSIYSNILECNNLNSSQLGNYIKKVTTKNLDIKETDTNNQTIRGIFDNYNRLKNGVTKSRNSDTFTSNYSTEFSEIIQPLIDLDLNNKYYSSKSIKEENISSDNINFDIYKTSFRNNNNESVKIINLQKTCFSRVVNDAVKLKTFDESGVSNYLRNVSSNISYETDYFDKENSKGTFDQIIDFKVSNNAINRFISNYNDTKLVKWGVYCNANFNTMKRFNYGINDFSKLSVFSIYNYFPHFNKNDSNDYYVYEKYGDTSYSAKPLVNEESNQLIIGDIRFDGGRYYSVTHNFNNNDTQHIKLPFVCKSNYVSEDIDSDSYIKNGYNTYKVSFTPRSRVLSVVKLIDIFSLPVFMTIKFNDDEYYSQDFYIEQSITSTDKNRIYPLFVGNIEFNQGDNYIKDYISDSRISGKLTKNDLLRISGNVLNVAGGGSVGYLHTYNEFGGMYNNSLYMNSEEDIIDPNVNITYVLKYLKL